MRVTRTICAILLLSGMAAAQAVIGEMFASDASVHGSVLFSGGGMQIQSGSSVVAGDAAAVLKLRRGGEVRVCPRTTVSVAASPNGRDLMWGMNSGAIEAHFTLSSSADTVMTPDFRILLPGPGIFHFAISSDSAGNACVRALPSNTASLIVSELNGDGTYQVKPNVAVVFRKGTIADISPLIPPDCGCPPPQPAVERAEVPKPPTPAPAPTAPNDERDYFPPPPLTPVSQAFTQPSVLAPPPQAESLHLQMEAPFVYKAGDPGQELADAAARLRLISGSTFGSASVLPPAQPPAPPTVQPPKTAQAETPKKPVKKGFFGKIGSFFSSIFR
ncbi:MAG TPA: hypothetical protein VN577_06485 [Terriglobales bacterium]|nr:hypothetical protein [Terriglobales bacterium]